MRGHAAVATGGGEPGSRVIAGKFRVERIIGEGGMGIVWAATDLHLERPVALKFLRDDFSSNWEAAVRFLREAKSAARLRSEHVARVLDVSVTDEGRPYIVMEYLAGQSLSAVLESRGPLALASATEYAIQVCEGLAEAHSCGIVHRDIKPANLFLVDGSPGWRAIKILDFGNAKRPPAESADVTTGVVMGSPCYMSPEQLGGLGPVDHRTDIWSLGATLFELLTGRTAFDPSRTLPELVSSILHRPHAGVRAFRPGIPAELAAIVDRCLAKERGDRFESAAALAHALSRFAPPSSAALVERAATMAPAFPDDAPVSARPVSQRTSDRAGPVSEVRHMGRVAVAEAEALPNSARVTHGTLTLGGKFADGLARPWRERWGPTLKLALAACGACALGALAAALFDSPRAASTSTVVFPAVASPLPQAPATVLRGPSKLEMPEPTAALPRPAAAPPINAPAPDPSVAPRRAPAAPSEAASLLPSATALPSASAHPAAPPASSVEAPAVDPQEVHPAGGRAPVRPIETKNPYQND